MARQASPSNDVSAVGVMKFPQRRRVDKTELARRDSDTGELVNLRCSALVLRDDTVLLCRREGAETNWVLPGGTPKLGEGTAAAARREVLEETSLSITADRVAFVLETTSRDISHHLIEIVFLGTEERMSSAPLQREPGLIPEFVALESLGSIGLRPPIAGYIRGYAKYQRAGNSGKAIFTAAYLGNLWRATGEDVLASESFGNPAALDFEP
jgi:ADP-ribose pyrophosphatase YjhB (NUDIX family)